MGPGDSTGGTGFGPLTLLANRGYRGTWMAGGIVSAVRWLEVIAVSVFVFTVTASPFAVSLLMFARLIPMALFGGLIGGAASIVRRERLLAFGFLAVGATRTTLGVLVVLDAVEVWHVMLGMFVSGILDSGEFPVRRSLAGDYVGPDRAAPALAFDQLTNVATMAFGPIVGGVLLDAIGLHGAYFVGALLNGLGLVIALTLPEPPAARRATRAPVLSALVEGLGYVRSQRLLVGALAVTLVFNVFAWPFTTMIPVIGREDLGLSAGRIGVLMSMLGLGSLTTTLVLSVRRPASLARVYFFGTMTTLLGVLVFSATTSFEAALVVLLITGLGLGGFSSNQGAIIFLNSAPQFRAQAMGLLTMAIGISPLGILHIGALAALVGTPAAIAVTALEGLVAVAIVYVRWPELHRKPPTASGPGSGAGPQTTTLK